MKYQLRDHGWPIGQFCVPEGVIIDTETTDPRDSWSIHVRDSGLPPPLSSQPLDQATFDYMKAIYPQHIHLIVTVPGLDGIERERPPEQRASAKRQPK